MPGGGNDGPPRRVWRGFCGNGEVLPHGTCDRVHAEALSGEDNPGAAGEFVVELREMCMNAEVELSLDALDSIGWRT